MIRKLDKALRKIHHRLGFRIYLTRLGAAYERARYGWAKWDIHGPGFAHSVGPAIGKQLIYFADNAIAYPGRTPYDTPEAWSADLRKHGTALAEDLDDVQIPKAYSDYLRARWTSGLGRSVEMSDEAKAGRDAMQAEEKRRVEAQKQAYIWLSEWAPSLWD